MPLPASCQMCRDPAIDRCAHCQQPLCVDCFALSCPAKVHTEAAEEKLQHRNIMKLWQTHRRPETRPEPAPMRGTKSSGSGAHDQAWFRRAIQIRISSEDDFSNGALQRAMAHSSGQDPACGRDQKHTPRGGMNMRKTLRARADATSSSDAPANPSGEKILLPFQKRLAAADWICTRKCRQGQDHGQRQQTPTDC